MCSLILIALNTFLATPGCVAADGAATHLATSDDAVVAITARPPLLGRLVRALLR